MTGTMINRVVTKVEDGCVAYASPYVDDLTTPCDIALVRNDDWTLACRFEDWDAAYESWKGTWTGYVDLSTGKLYPLNES